MEDKNDKVTISFIVPVYNGEESIRIALESALQEKSIPIEIIVIDDGSEDGTAQILKEIAEEDPRLIVYRTDQRGTGAARDLGLDKAVGKYIFFLDADDTVIRNGIRELLREAENGSWDIVCGNYQSISGTKISKGFSSADSGEVVRNDIPRSLYQQIKNESLFGYCWNKLYRREFLQLFQLRIAEGKDVYMEDTLFNLEAFSHAPRYCFLDVPVYNYYIRPETISHRADDRMAGNCIRMQRMYVEYLKKHHCWEENQDLFVPLVMRQFCWIIFNSTCEDNICRAELKKRVVVFTKEEYFCEMVKNIQNRSYLQWVVSPIQRTMYLWCFDLLNHGQYDLLVTVFKTLNPAMRIYAKKWRKI